jgi:hypothetical protein
MPRAAPRFQDRWARSPEPQAIDAYRAELAASGWPLSELEEAAIAPVYGAFRVGMAAAEMEDGRITGSYDLAMIERQLSRTATAAPLRGDKGETSILEQLPGHHHPLDLVGALVDLGDRGPADSFRR